MEGTDHAPSSLFLCTSFLLHRKPDVGELGLQHKGVVQEERLDHETGRRLHQV